MGERVRWRCLFDSCFDGRSINCEERMEESIDEVSRMWK